MFLLNTSWWKLAKFATVRSRLYRRIFEIFLPNRLDLVELYPKCFLNFFFRIFFRGRNLTTKSEFSDFVANFWIFFSSNFCKFKGSGSRFGLILTDREERIQKFVDTAEKWLVENREILGHFPLLKTRRTCRRSFAAIWAARTPTKVPFSTAWRVVLGAFFVFCVGDVWRAGTGFARCTDFLPFSFCLRNSNFLSLAATVRRGNFFFRTARFFVDSTFASSRVGLVLEVCKSWVELVTISKSYDQNKFSIGFY